MPTGRVYRCAANGTLTRLMDGLRFANGRAGTTEVLAELPGFPDNLAADDDGNVWIAFALEPNLALEGVQELPLFVRRLAARLPARLVPKPSRVAWISAYDERGACVHDFKSRDGGYAMVTGVCPVGRRMWCAGLQERELMRFDLPGREAASEAERPLGGEPSWGKAHETFTFPSRPSRLSNASKSNPANHNLIQIVRTTLATPSSLHPGIGVFNVIHS